MTRHHINAAALRHMRRAVAEGWHAESMVCDKAVEALMQEGHDPQLAALAVRAVWREHFDVTDPI